ncbi:MAG: helix-turn-helix domain-containing protein [Chloroflexota bacterium]
MDLWTRQPSHPLNHYIELLTYYKNYEPNYTSTRMLPDGTTELLIILDDIQRVFYKDKRSVFSCKKAVISGPQKEYVYADAAGNSLLAVKFKAGGIYPFLSLPIFELDNLFVDADQFWGSTILSLREQLFEIDEPHQMFSLVENYLMGRLMQQEQPQLAINSAVKFMKSSSLPMSQKEIADTFGYSQKQFIHQFKKRVGLSPKYYQRVARFNKVLRKANQSPILNWSQIGPAYGFYDQAHLINEFRYFSGLKPKDYLEQKGEVPNFVPIY